MDEPSHPRSAQERAPPPPRCAWYPSRATHRHDLSLKSTFASPPRLPPLSFFFLTHSRYRTHAHLVPPVSSSAIRVWLSLWPLEQRQKKEECAFIQRSNASSSEINHRGKKRPSISYTAPSVCCWISHSLTCTSETHDGATMAMLDEDERAEDEGSLLEGVAEVASVSEDLVSDAATSTAISATVRPLSAADWIAEAKRSDTCNRVPTNGLRAVVLRCPSCSAYGRILPGGCGRLP